MPDCAGCAKMCNNLRNPTYLYLHLHLPQGQVHVGTLPGPHPSRFVRLSERSEKNSSKTKHSKARTAKQIMASQAAEAVTSIAHCHCPLLL